MDNRLYPAPLTTTSNPIITLNIGGSKYTTTLQTLTSNSHALFASLLRTLPRDKDGDIFIDRDPVYFRYILDSLRLGEIQHPYSCDSHDCLRFWKEIDFFRLLAPGHIWGFSRKKKLRHPAIKVSDDGFCATKILKSKPAIASVCGNNALNNGIYRWRVIVNGILGGITFGIVHIDAFKLRKLRSSDVFGYATSGQVYNIEKYGANEDDDEESDKDDPISMLKTEEELGKRVILNESGDEEEEEERGNEQVGKEIEAALSVEGKEEDSDESDSPLKKVKFNDESSRDSESGTLNKLYKEERFLMEYDAGTGVIKVYKQDEGVWYTGKVVNQKDGYYFFITLKNIGDSVKVELLE